MSNVVEQFSSFVKADSPQSEVLAWMKTLTDEERQQIQVYALNMAEAAGAILLVAK